MAAQLRDKPRMGCEVVRLEQDPLRGKAAAVYREAGRLRRVEGDFLLCTLPFPVVARIEVAPELSGEKRRAIRELGYDSATKILAVTGRRFWEQDDHIYGGGTYTDLPTGTTWYPGDNATARDPRVSAAPAVFLASYSWGQTARRWASMAHGERSHSALRHLARVHLVHARTAHGALPPRRGSRGPHLLRGRARLADPHVDAGRAGVRAGRRPRDAGRGVVLAWPERAHAAPPELDQAETVSQRSAPV